MTLLLVLANIAEPAGDECPRSAEEFLRRRLPRTKLISIEELSDRKFQHLDTQLNGYQKPSKTMSWRKAICRLLSTRSALPIRP